ncbi:MAG TPA: hypothetical protein VNG13_00185 [Mycobacteriales bacterium]|nr:hypothetical protein [Mycobacteriales bacterium]
MPAPARVADLLDRLDAAADADWLSAEPDVLAAQASLALELAARFATPGEFARFCADCGYWFDEWLLNLPMLLADAGLVEQAVTVADTVGRIDERHDSLYACLAASGLARAGRVEAARARIANNMGRWADLPSTWVESAEALAALGDLERRWQPTSRRCRSPRSAMSRTRSWMRTSGCRGSSPNIRSSGPGSGRCASGCVRRVIGAAGRRSPAAAPSGWRATPLPMRERTEVQTLLRMPPVSRRTQLPAASCRRPNSVGHQASVLWPRLSVFVQTRRG